MWHCRCPDDTAIPAKPSQACHVWRSRLRCWCAVAIVVASLGVVGSKQCPWRNLTGRNHTLSGLVIGVARCRCCLCPLHDQPIDLAGVYLGTPGSPYANVYVNSVLDETSQEEITHCQVRWPGWPRAERCCLCPLHDQHIDLAGITRGAHIECISSHYETANIPLSNGSNIMYFCSVFVKIWFCKILR